MAFDLVSRVSRHEYVRIGSQAICAALGAAALEVANLLNASIELGFPGFFGDIDIFAVEYLVDRIGAKRVRVSSLLNRNEDFVMRLWRSQKLESCQTYLQAVPSLK
jgi:hypothetical protein